jgi:hypothetical protein
MDLQRAKFMKTLTSDELAEFAELEMMWDRDWFDASSARTKKEREMIINRPLPGELEDRFQLIIEKLRQHNSTLNLYKP